MWKAHPKKEVRLRGCQGNKKGRKLVPLMFGTHTAEGVTNTCLSFATKAFGILLDFMYSSQGSTLYIYFD
jgi:hypothetical protein